MKLITDQIYGDRRAYIGAIGVVWIRGWRRPTVGWCADIAPDNEPPAGEPRWSYPDDDGAMQNDSFTFQPDPAKLAPGEWCWPVTQPPITAESIKEVRRQTGCPAFAAKKALEGARGEIGAAVKLCGGNVNFFGPCCHGPCLERATSRSSDTREWCDVHVPENETVWRPR